MLGQYDLEVLESLKINEKKGLSVKNLNKIREWEKENLRSSYLTRCHVRPCGVSADRTTQKPTVIFEKVGSGYQYRCTVCGAKTSVTALDAKTYTDGLY